MMCAVMAVVGSGWEPRSNCGQENSDDPALIDGWAIYVRAETPDDPQQPFDLHELPDHPTYTSAESAARALALQLLGDAEAWNLD